MPLWLAFYMHWWLPHSHWRALKVPSSGVHKRPQIYCSQRSQPWHYADHYATRTPMNGRWEPKLLTRDSWSTYLFQPFLSQSVPVAVRMRLCTCASSQRFDSKLSGPDSVTFAVGAKQLRSARFADSYKERGHTHTHLATLPSSHG